MMMGVFTVLGFYACTCKTFIESALDFSVTPGTVCYHMVMNLPIYPQASNIFVGQFCRKLDFVNPENHDDGVELVLVLRRRLMSAILTIYFPTILILTIVYATNFFKDFFFEVNID